MDDISAPLACSRGLPGGSRLRGREPALDHHSVSESLRLSEQKTFIIVSQWSPEAEFKSFPLFSLSKAILHPEYIC